MPRPLKVCQSCGRDYSPQPHGESLWRASRFCSLACRYLGQERDIESRFWSKVDTSAGLFGCWLWTGATARGYGTFGSGGQFGRNVLAHRFAWQRKNGPIPAGMVICHSCDNPPCVNPAHLWIGTHADNVADKIAKGRSRLTLTDSPRRR